MESKWNRIESRRVASRGSWKHLVGLGWAASLYLLSLVAFDKIIHHGNIVETRMGQGGVVYILLVVWSSKVNLIIDIRVGFVGF